LVSSFYFCIPVGRRSLFVSGGDPEPGDFRVVEITQHGSGAIEGSNRGSEGVLRLGLGCWIVDGELGGEAAPIQLAVILGDQLRIRISSESSRMVSPESLAGRRALFCGRSTPAVRP
jgi:hypothetical protein